MQQMLVLPERDLSDIRRSPLNSIKIHEKRPFSLEKGLFDFCGISWNRTSDTRIFSPLLYQLSYDTARLGIANVAFFLFQPTFF